MSLPDGVTTCLLTYGPITDTFGNTADSITVEVVADRTIVHGASGRTLFKSPVSVTAAPGGVAQLPVPHTNQSGFRDQQQNALTGWYYTVRLTARFGNTIETDTKTFQPLVGQTTVDADLLPSDGMVTPGVTTTTAVVTSVAGFTEVVTADQIAAAVGDGLSATFARQFESGKVYNDGVVLVGPAGEIVTTYYDGETSTDFYDDLDNGYLSYDGVHTIAGLNGVPTAADLATATRGVLESVSVPTLRRRVLPAAADTLTVSGEVPTVTTSTSATTITSNQFAAPLRVGGTNAGDWDLVNDAKFLVGGTPAMKPSGSDPARVRSPQIGVSNPQSARYVPSITFYYDGSAFEWYGAYPGNKLAYRLVVDGRLSVIDGSIDMSGGKVSIKWDFGTAKTRLITLIVDDPEFRQINYQPTYTLWRPDQVHARRLFLFSDSIGRGTYIDATSSSAFTLGRLLGCDEVWLPSIGGTSWTATDGTQFGGNRMTECAPYIRPNDIAVFFGTRNDSSGTAPQLAAITSTITSVLTGTPQVAACSNVFVVTNITVITTMAAAILAGASAAGRPGINASTWITGTGTTAAPNGTGNADRYIGADGVHPGNNEAYRYLARRIDSGIRSNLAG